MKLIIPALIILTWFPPLAQGQNEKKAMSIIDFLNIPGLSNPRLSPDGQRVLYRLSESDWDANKQIGHIWITEIDGSDARQITFGKEGESNPLWSPDGQWISFVAKRYDDKVNQIYIMRTDGGEAMRLTDHATAVSSVKWSSSGEFLYFLANDERTKEEKAAKELQDDVFSLDEDYQQKHLWKADVPDGQETRITEGDYSILDFDESKDGSQIIVHKGVNPLFDFYKDSEIWAIDAEGKNGRQLTDNSVGESGARISPDGKRVVFVVFANENFEFYYNSKLFLVPADGRELPTIIDIDWPYEINSTEWSADGKSVFMSVNMGNQKQLWQYNLRSKKRTQLTKGDHAVNQWHYQPKLDRYIMTVSTPVSPGEIFKLEDGSLMPVTNHYGYLDEEYHLPKQEVVTWKGEDGQEVEGIIYYPNNYQSGQRYPLVVQTHGGPAASVKYGFSRGFTRYNAVLSGKGYVVLQPNYRGSTGYGDDFLRDMVGGYFRQSHLDVMAGVDHLIANGIADPDRMVKMGWSAGGHMTNKIITFTGRFKAASSGAGAVNWIGMYAQSDIRTYRTPWFGGSPWQKDAPIDNYWDHSPLKDISNVTTPTLVFVGEKDPRVPLPQSVELYRALRSLDVPTHLYVAPREPHGWRELRHRLSKINLELEWFARYALGEEYVWEEAESSEEDE